MTALAYKNMAVHRTTSGHPVLWGPVLFHFDTKPETHLVSLFGPDGMNTEILGESSLISTSRGFFHSSHVRSTRRYNRVLKAEKEWRQLQRVTDLVDEVKKKVLFQLIELRRSLHGRGDFILSDPFMKHLFKWDSLSGDHQDKKFSAFFSDTGKRQPPETAATSDGACILDTAGHKLKIKVVVRC